MRNAGDELPPRGRLLAVDLGDVRTGLALSDPHQMVASPLDTLAVSDPEDTDELVKAVAPLIEEHEVAGIVVGLPRSLSGREEAPAQRARRAAKALRESLSLPVRLWDERFSTTEAERVMLGQDASRRERKQKIDRVAAGIILQGVLESQRNRR